jgi:hypothetical protein
MIVKIRYKTDAKTTDSLQWRVLIAGHEYYASEVHINCPTLTTRDMVEGVGEKWHITCEAKEIDWIGEKCIVS